MIEYKGYQGQASFDSESGFFHGEVSGIRDVITFQARTCDELQSAFRDSIEEYLKFCMERGKDPDAPRTSEPSNLHEVEEVI